MSIFYQFLIDTGQVAFIIGILSSLLDSRESYQQVFTTWKNTHSQRTKLIGKLERGFRQDLPQAPQQIQSL